jgi:hypothetical protein
LVLCPLSFIVALAGCRNNCDLVEAELRTREMQLIDLRTERDHLLAHNEALRREISALRGGSPWKLSPEEASQTYTLRSIVLGRQTGGLDDDGKPGDEALQVLVEPRDADGHTVKVPGTLTVMAFEITPEGLKRPLCAWDVSGDALRRAWKNGLLSTGYYLVLPWKTWPGNEKVRVVARLILSDGRTFEAEKDVTVRLVPPAHRKPLPEPADRPREEGPPPRKLEGADTLGWRSSSRAAAGPPATLWQRPGAPSLIDAVEFRAPVPLPDPAAR